MKAQQIEISFGEKVLFRPSPRTAAPRTRAAWWFERMRVVVEDVAAWRPGRPKGTYNQGELPV